MLSNPWRAFRWTISGFLIEIASLSERALAWFFTGDNLKAGTWATVFLCSYQKNRNKINQTLRDLQNSAWKCTIMSLPQSEQPLFPECYVFLFHRRRRPNDQRSFSTYKSCRTIASWQVVVSVSFDVSHQTLQKPSGPNLNLLSIANEVKNITIKMFYKYLIYNRSNKVVHDHGSNV